MGWVHGNLTVKGEVHGKGAVFATGGITMEGPIPELAPSNVWVLRAGGQLRLGRPIVMTIG